MPERQRAWRWDWELSAAVALVQAISGVMTMLAGGLFVAVSLLMFTHSMTMSILRRRTDD